MKTGIELIAKERQEQIEKHGRTVKEDVKYNKEYQLSKAADWLLIDPISQGDELALGFTMEDCCPKNWNQDIWNKMCNKTYKERLIIAGALIAAEIDRLNYDTI